MLPSSESDKRIQGISDEVVEPPEGKVRLGRRLRRLVLGSRTVAKYGTAALIDATIPPSAESYTALKQQTTGTRFGGGHPVGVSVNRPER